jgi:hypothetical protein
LCIATRNIESTPADVAAQHCRDAVERSRTAEVTPAELYRALKELTLALESGGELDEAAEVARQALWAAPKHKREEATENLDRLLGGN